MSYLFITSTKTKETPSRSPHWAQSDSTSRCLPATVTRTLLRHFLSRMCSAERFLQNYHLEHHPSCSPVQAHSQALLPAIKWWGFYPTSCPKTPILPCQAFTLLVGTTNTHQPVNRESGALLPSSAQPLSSDTAECLIARRQSRYVPLQRNTNLQSRVASFLKYNTWRQYMVLIKMLLPIVACWFSSMCFNRMTGFVSAPTAVPTVSEGKPVDECDDDQANCHSGTGDDYQLTGAETIFIPLQLHFSSYPSSVTS